MFTRFYYTFSDFIAGVNSSFPPQEPPCTIFPEMANSESDLLTPDAEDPKSFLAKNQTLFAAHPKGPSVPRLKRSVKGQEVQGKQTTPDVFDTEPGSTSEITVQQNARSLKKLCGVTSLTNRKQRDHLEELQPGDEKSGISLRLRKANDNLSKLQALGSNSSTGDERTHTASAQDRKLSATQRSSPSDSCGSGSLKSLFKTNNVVTLKEFMSPSQLLFARNNPLKMRKADTNDRMKMYSSINSKKEAIALYILTYYNNGEGGTWKANYWHQVVHFYQLSHSNIVYEEVGERIVRSFIGENGLRVDQLACRRCPVEFLDAEDYLNHCKLHARPFALE